MENCFLFDWLTVSFTDDYGFADIIGILGIDRCFEEQKTGSRLKYGHRLAFDGISVHYTEDSDNRPNKGVCLEMSGQGCRDFETFGKNDWVALFTDIAEMHGTITRLDVAYDDFTGVLPLDIIADMAKVGLFTARSKAYEVHYSYKQRDKCGLTVSHGSRTSDTFIRIYDKRAERNAWDELEHWVRCEIQMRKNCAQGFLDRLEELGSLGAAFTGVLQNYLTYRCKTSDSNLSRSPAAPWWQRFVKDAEALRIHCTKGIDYNKDRLAAHIDRNHNAIKTMILVEGLSSFLENNFGHTEPMPEKYKRILQAEENGDQILAVLNALPCQQIQMVTDSL